MNEYAELIAKVEGFLAHSRGQKTEHTCVPNQMLEVLVNEAKFAMNGHTWKCNHQGSADPCICLEADPGRL